MKLRIEPGSHLPVYVQLKEQIKFLILNGDLQAGTSLPPTRQLAGFLRINRNTVLKAYKELEQEGLIECRQGRGCIVGERVLIDTKMISSELLSIIDQAIDQAGKLGIRPGEFASFVYARAGQRRDIQITRRLVFVECEGPIVVAVAKNLQDRLGVEVAPLTLKELREPTPEIENKLRDAHAVVTTFFHIQEVKRLLTKTKKEVVAIVVKPHLDKLIKISAIPQGTPVALVCVNESCACDMKRSLEHAGIKGMDTSLFGVDDQQKLTDMLPGYPVIIASDFISDKVQPLVQPDQELIVMEFTAVDEGAIELLESMLRVEQKAMEIDL